MNRRIFKAMIYSEDDSDPKFQGLIDLIFGADGSLSPEEWKN